MGEVQMIDIFAKHHTITIKVKQADSEEILGLDFVFKQPSEEEYIETMYGSVAIPKNVMKEMNQRGNSNLQESIMENFDILQNQYALRKLLYSTLQEAPSFDKSKDDAKDYFNRLDMELRQQIVLKFSEFVFGSSEGTDSKKFQVLSDDTTGQL